MVLSNSGIKDSTGLPSYLLDNAGKEAPRRLSALAAMFDSGTIRHLESRGVGPGWRCLEVGGEQRAWT